MSEMNVELGVVAEKECKIVSEPSIARKLLKDGYRIVDIKPKRGHEKETIFVFATEDGFSDALSKYSAERREKRAKAAEEKPE